MPARAMITGLRRSQPSSLAWIAQFIARLLSFTARY
jgi:hypothetical protein